MRGGAGAYLKGGKGGGFQGRTAHRLLCFKLGKSDQRKTKKEEQSGKRNLDREEHGWKPHHARIHFYQLRHPDRGKPPWGIRQKKRRASGGNSSRIPIKRGGFEKFDGGEVAFES